MGGHLYPASWLDIFSLGVYRVPICSSRLINVFPERQKDFRMAVMDKPTRQDVEAVKAQTRIDFYLKGGSRSVYISRWVVSALLVLFLIAIWWHGIG